MHGCFTFWLLKQLGCLSGWYGRPFVIQENPDGPDQRPDEVEHQDDAHHDDHEKELEKPHPPVPPHGAQPVEIDLAEGDEENEEHEEREDGIDERRHGIARRIKRRNPRKEQINNGPHPHGEGQGPFFHYLQKIVHFPFLSF